MQPRLHVDRQWRPDVTAGVLDDQRHRHGLGDRDEVAHQLLVTRPGEPRRGRHHRVRADVLRMLGMPDGHRRGLSAHAHHRDPMPTGKRAGQRGHLVAFLGRQPEHFGDHGEDNAVGSVGEQPVELGLHRPPVDTAVVIEGSLEHRQHTGDVAAVRRWLPHRRGLVRKSHLAIAFR